MTGSVHRSHRRTVLASACLLLVIALTACGLGSGKPDGPGRSSRTHPHERSRPGGQPRERRRLASPERNVRGPR